MVADIPIDNIRKIADNLDEVQYMRLADELIPFSFQTEGINVTSAATYHAAGYKGAGMKVAIIDGGFAGVQSASSGMINPIKTEETINFLTDRIQTR